MTNDPDWMNSANDRKAPYTEEELEFLDRMKKKYYKMYFKMLKEQKKNETESSSNMLKIR